MVLEQNLFVEQVLPGSDPAEAQRRRNGPLPAPFRRRRARTAGRPLSWPRNIPIDGEPADVVAVVEDYGNWLAESDVPKLFVNAEPGALLAGGIREVVRAWPNRTEATSTDVHFIQEDSPDEIGAAVAQFVRALRTG